LVPYAAILEVLIGRLGMDGEGLGVGEGLEGDVELGVGAEVAASVSEVGSFEEGRVWERLLVAFKAGAGSGQ